MLLREAEVPLPMAGMQKYDRRPLGYTGQRKDAQKQRRMC